MIYALFVIFYSVKSAVSPGLSTIIKYESCVSIGQGNASLFEDTPEFYATYQMQNVKNHRIYTDKIRLSVVELNHIELATEEDRLHKIDQWAKLFKIKTWEELKAMAATDQYMESAADTMYELSADRMIREQCRRRAEYELYQKYQAEENARKDAVIAEQSAVIEDLKRQLAKAQRKD